MYNIEYERTLMIIMKIRNIRTLLLVATGGKNPADIFICDKFKHIMYVLCKLLW